jgi:hypothetical protein
MTDANPYAAPLDQRPPFSPAEEKQWSILTHLGSLFFPVIAAAVMFFLFRGRGPFIRAHVTTAWNFQLTVAIGIALGFVFAFGSFFATFLSRDAIGSVPAVTRPVLRGLFPDHGDPASQLDLLDHRRRRGRQGQLLPLPDRHPVREGLSARPAPRPRARAAAV